MSKITFSAIAALVLTVGSFVGCSHNRTDAEIANEVQSKINSDSLLATKQVSVTANDGVVTLSGTVGNDTERTTASGDASQVKGVKTVLNNLQVTPTAAGTLAQVTPTVRPEGKSRNSVARRASTPAGPPAAPPVSNPRAMEVPVVTIPEGTALSIRLVDGIDSDKNKPGDTFAATLESPLVADGRVVFPKNSDIEGKIQNAKSAGHFAGRSEVALVLTKLSFNGKSYQLATDEYSQSGASRGKRTAATVGGVAAVGALIGGLTGGGKGALIGAGVGAGAGTGVQAVTKGQQIRLASESILEFRLNAPLTIQ